MFLVTYIDRATAPGYEDCSNIRRMFYDCKTKSEVIEEICKHNEEDEDDYSFYQILAITELSDEEYKRLQECWNRTR